MLSWESTILSLSKSALTSTCKSGRLKLGSGADTVLSCVILCSNSGPTIYTSPTIEQRNVAQQCASTVWLSMWCTMSHKGCQSNSSADPDRPLVGDLKLEKKFSQLHSKLSFGIFYFFSFLSDYQNQVPVGLSNIDIVFILSRIPNPILLSLLLETSSHCRLTADIVVIHPFPILAPSPPPS